MAKSINYAGSRQPSPFVFGGALVAGIALVSILAHTLSQTSESHAVASRQWLASFCVFIMFLTAALIPRDIVRSARQNGKQLSRNFVDLGYRNARAKRFVITTSVICAIVLPATIASKIAIYPDPGLSQPLFLLASTIICALCFFRLQWPSAATTLLDGLLVTAGSAFAKIDDRDRFKIAFVSIPLLFGATIVAIIATPAVSGGLALAALVFTGTYSVRRLSNQPHSFLNIVFSAGTLLLVGFLLGSTAWLASENRRTIAIAAAIVQATLFARLQHISLLKVRQWLPLLLASLVGWTFSVTYPFTPLANALLGASKTTATSVIAFVAAFAIVLMELTNESTSQKRTQLGRATIWVFAIFVFAELGLRTDSLLTDFVPYHRSYWVGPADFVRSGGWLLWDIPAQYGFLSALSLAVWPAASTWQALYEQTALALIFDGIVLFWLLREKRAGILNASFALLVTVATLFSSEGARSPFGWRLYPQAGLRFTGLIALIALTYAIYKSSGLERRIRAFYWIGFVLWIGSVAWSLETGILTTVFWASFVAFDLFYRRHSLNLSKRALVLSASARLLPFVYLPILFVSLVEIYYRLKLGHGPDWTGFFEFSFVYQTEQLDTKEIVTTGPGWVLISILIGVGAEALRSVRLRLSSAPMICALWLGTWGVCSYYVGEGFNNHINVLSPILALTIAVLLALRRTESDSAAPPLAIYSLFAPLLILCIAEAFVDPVELSSIKAPLIPGYSFDSTASFANNGDELKNLETAAGVRPSDRIIYPESNWHIKLDLGLTMPFISDPSGRIVQQVAWLPVSPVGPFDMLMTLPYERRDLYLNRYFSQVRETGWLLSYHQPVDCKRYIRSLVTVDVHRSLNYEIGRCVGPTVRRFSGHISH